MNTFDQTNFQTVSRTGPFRRLLNGLGLVILVVLGAVISPDLDVVEKIRQNHITTPVTEPSMVIEMPPSAEASMGTANAAEPPRGGYRPSEPPSTTAHEPIESEWDQPRRIAWGEILRRIEHGLGWLNRLWTRTMLA